jgi:hypothetical protein
LPITLVMGTPPNKAAGLLSDYCSLEGDIAARLSDTERLTFVGGDDLSKLFRRLERSSLGLSFKDLLSSLDESKISRYLDFYDAYNQSNSAESLFGIPKGIITPKIIPVHGLSEEGEIVDLEYQSAFESQHPQFKSIQASIPENNNIRVRYWRHHQGSRTTLVCVHGWTMNDQRVQALAFLPGIYFKLGFDVALFELPFHGRRLNSEFRDAGHTLFPSSNVMITNESILQSVSDLRQLKLILRALGVKKVGALGVSLGAYISTIWSCFDQLECGIMMLPFSSFANLACYHAKKEKLSLSEQELEKLHKSFNFHSPLNFNSITDSQRLMFVSSTYDSVIPCSEVESLKSKYQNAQFVSVAGDHSVSLERDKLLEATGGFLSKF